MAAGQAVAVQGDFQLLGELMDAAAEQIGQHEAYVDGDRRLTFAQWVRVADAVAALFAAHGVARGDVVALHLGNGIEYAVSYAAAARLGAVVTGINRRLGPLEVGAILARCQPRLVVVEAGDPPLSASTDSVLAPTVAVVDSAAVAAAAGGRPLQPVDRRRGVPDDPVTIVWTSGTTGSPKGAWFDHRNLAAAVRSAGCMTLPFDRRLAAVPFAHAGYMAKLWEQLAMGVTFVLSPTPWTAASMLDVLVRERVTVGGGVPAQWAKLLEVPGVEDADFSALRLGVVSTAPAPPELIERVGRLIGCPLVVRYAMTESPSITGTEPDDPPEVQYGTVGRPQDGVVVRVVAEDGQPLPAGQVGRVLVGGACVMRGYWGDPERTAEVLAADGTLTSNDLGSFDPDGNLVLAGRLDDLYIRGGYNVHPLEVEHVLEEHPLVHEAAVVGSPVPVLGEIGVAVVVPTVPAQPPTLGELRDWVKERLADYKAPDRLEIVAELPRTSMLKLDKRALKQWLLRESQ